MSKPLIKLPYAISRAIPMDMDFCRLHAPSVLSSKADNHAPISFDQHAEVFQGHVVQKIKESCTIKVHRGGALELVKPARESASSHPKPCTFLKNVPGVFPVRRSLLALVEQKTVVRDHISTQKPPGSCV